MAGVRGHAWLLVVLVLVTASCGSRDAVEGGPLAETDRYSDETAFTVDLDRSYSWGLATLTNSGNADAVVESVSLAEPDGTIRMIGARAVPERTPITVGFAPGFDSRAGKKVEGLVVPPGKGNGFSLIVGLEVDEPGVSRFQGVDVVYRVGSRRFETTLEHVVILCAPVEAYEECPPPDSASTDAAQVVGVPRTRQGEG